MAQVSYGTITITDTNDIESITVEYNRNQSSSSAPSPTDSGWSTTRPDWAQGYYIWQRTRVHKSGTTTDKDVIGTAVCITGSTGSSGTSVTISSIKYAVSTTESQPADSSFTHTSVPTVAEGAWLWTLVTYSNGSKAYTKSKQGVSGDSITVSKVEYQSGTSPTSAPTGTWQTSIPTVAEGNYLWTKTTYSDGNYTYSVAKQGKSGTSVSISSTSTTYQVSTSPTTTPTGEWKTTVQSTTTGQYLWTRTVVTYSDGNSTTSYSVAAHGATGTSISISSIKYAVSSTDSQPADNSFTYTSVPTVNEGQWLWTLTTYSNGSKMYTKSKQGKSGNDGQSLTATKTEYTIAANNVTINSSNHTSYTWTTNTPDYDASKPAYWGRITNTYANPAKTEYLFYKDEAITKAVADAAIANSIAQHANEDAQGAMSQSSAALQRVQAKYGTSSTAATTAAKVASCEGFQLFNGAEVFIKFTNKNNVANPTLNVNSTGAKSIRDSDGNALDSKFYWKDGSLVHFVYDGTYWRILDIVTTEKYNNLVSDIDGISRTVGTKASQTDLTNLTARVSTNETNISQTATSITSLVSNQDTYTAPDGTTKTNTIKSAIKQNADNISLRVEKNGVIAAINASTESSGGSAVKISADKVNIEGAAIFTSGRLSTTSLNNTIDGRIPEIPTKVSDLSDSSSYAKTTDIPDVSGLASKTDSVKSVTTETQYRLSNSSTSLTGSGTGYSWSTTIPTWSSNKYLWTRIATTYTPISGNATTVYKPGIPDNQYGIYDSQLTTALSTASSAQTTANGAAASVTTTQEYNLSSSTSSANGTWQSTVPTWSANHYIWVRLKIVKTPMSGTASTSYTPSESGTYDKALTTALSTAASAKTTADAAAPKTSAVAEEQYIYISKASGTTSVSGTTTWVTETGDKQNTWTTKRPTYNTSYPVLFVAKQKKVVSGTVTCTTPVKDDTTTIIDGGHITTGTIDSKRLNADTIKVNAANVQGSLTIGQVDGLEKITTDLENSVYGVTTYVYEHQDTSTSETISEIVYVDNSGTEPRYYYIDGDVEHEVNKSQLKTEVVDGETQLVTTITNITTDISAQLSDFNDSINSELATLNGTVNNYLGANGYINLATDGSEPCIIIGQGEFFVKITNKEMGFYQRPENITSIEEGVEGVTKVAWISSNELVISQSQIKNKQQIGDFMWEVRETTDGHKISLKHNKLIGENNE